MIVHTFFLFIICCQAHKKNNWTYNQWKASHNVKKENAEKRSSVVPNYKEINIDTNKLFHDFVSAFEAKNDQSQNSKEESRRTKVDKNQNSDSSVRNLVYPGPSLSSPTAAAFDPYLMKQSWAKDSKGTNHAAAVPKTQPVAQQQVAFAPSIGVPSVSPVSPPNGFFLPPSFPAVVLPAPHAQSMVNTVFTPSSPDPKTNTIVVVAKDDKEQKPVVKTGNPVIEKVINNPRNTPIKGVPVHDKKKKKTTNGNKRVYSLGDHIFSDIGCFLDKWIRAVPTLEGNHPLLMDSDYKSRSDPLQKCAEAALDKGFQVFGLQNGGQCFAGINGETTYDMYGTSNQCLEDGLGGSWAMEMYRYNEDIRNNRNKPALSESKLNSKKDNAEKMHFSDSEDKAEKKEEDEFDKSLFKEEQELDSDDNKKVFPTEPLSAHGISFKGVLGKLIRKAVSESKMKTAIEPEETVEDAVPKKAGKIEKNSEEPKSTPEKPVEKEKEKKKVVKESEAKKKETDPKEENEEKEKTTEKIVDKAADKIADKAAAKAVDSLKAVTELFKSAISEKAPPGKYEKPVVKNDTVVNFVKDDEPTKSEVGQTHSRFFPLGALVSKGSKPPCICPDKICSSKLDLAFVIDASAGSEQNGKDKMAETMEFGRRVASAFKVDQENSHLGLVTYATDAQIMLNFHHFNDPDTLTEARDAVRVKPHTGKYTGQALSLAKEGLFDKGHRSDALDVLILMTDGPSSDDVTEPSRALRDMGVKIIAVGIGNQIDRKQLNDIASDPDDEHVFTADYDNLGTIIRRTQRAACVGGTLRDPIMPCICEAQADIRADVQTAAFYNMYKFAVEPSYKNVMGVTRYNIPRPAISHKKNKWHRKSEVEGNRHHFLRTLPLDNPHPPMEDSSPIHELRQKETPSFYPARSREAMQTMKASKDEDGAVTEVHHDPLKEDANVESIYADTKYNNRLETSDKNYHSEEHDQEHQKLQGRLEGSRDYPHDNTYTNSYKNKDKESDDFIFNSKERTSFKQQEDSNDLSSSNSDFLGEKNKHLKNQKTYEKIGFENEDGSQSYSSDDKQLSKSSTNTKKIENQEYQSLSDAEQGNNHGSHQSNFEQSNDRERANNEIHNKKPRIKNNYENNEYGNKKLEESQSDYSNKKLAESQSDYGNKKLEEPQGDYGNKKLEESQGERFLENQREKYDEKENDKLRTENEKNSEKEDNRDEKEENDFRETKVRNKKNENQVNAQKERKEGFQEEENEQKAVNKENLNSKLVYDDPRGSLQFHKENSKEISEDTQVSVHPKLRYSLYSDSKTDEFDKDRNTVEKGHYVTTTQKQKSLDSGDEDSHESHERLKFPKVKLNAEKVSLGKQLSGVDEQPSTEVFNQAFSDSKKEFLKEDKGEQGISESFSKEKEGNDHKTLPHSLSAQAGNSLAADSRSEKIIDKGLVTGQVLGKFEDNLKQLKVLHIPDEKLAHFQADPIEPVNKLHHAFTAEESLQLRLDEEKEKVHEDISHFDDHQDEIASIVNQHLTKEDQEQLHAIQATLMNADNQLLDSTKQHQSLDHTFRPEHSMDSLQLGINLGNYVHGNSDGSLQQIPLLDTSLTKEDNSLAKEDASQIVKYKGYSNVVSEGILKPKEFNKPQKIDKKKGMGENKSEQKGKLSGEETSKDTHGSLKENPKGGKLQRNMLISDDVQTHPERSSFQIISKAMQTIADKELPSVLDDTPVLHDSKIDYLKGGKENLNNNHEGLGNEVNAKLDETPITLKSDKLTSKEKENNRNEHFELEEDIHHYENNKQEKKGDDESTANETGNKNIIKETGNENMAKDIGNEAENMGKKIKNSNKNKNKVSDQVSDQDLNKNQNEAFEATKDYQHSSNKKDYSKEYKEDYQSFNDNKEGKVKEELKGANEENKATHSIRKVEKETEKIDQDKSREEKNYEEKKFKEEEDMNKMQEGEQRYDPIQNKKSKDYEDNRTVKDNNKEEFDSKDNKDENYSEVKVKNKGATYEEKDEAKLGSNNHEDNQEKDVKASYLKEKQNKFQNEKSGKSYKFDSSKETLKSENEHDENSTETFEKESFDERNDKKFDFSKSKKIQNKESETKENSNKNNEEDKTIFQQIKPKDQDSDSKTSDNLKTNENEQEENKDRLKSSRNVESLHEDSMAPLYEVETKNDKNFYHGNDEASMFQKRLEEAQKFDSIKSQGTIESEKISGAERKLSKEDVLKSGNILRFEQNSKTSNDEIVLNEGRRKTEALDSDHELRRSEGVVDLLDDHSKELYFHKSKYVDDKRPNSDEDIKKFEDNGKSLAKKDVEDKNIEVAPEDFKQHEESSFKSADIIQTGPSKIHQESSSHQSKDNTEANASRRFIATHETLHERKGDIRDISMKGDIRDVSMDNKLIDMETRKDDLATETNDRETTVAQVTSNNNVNSDSNRDLDTNAMKKDFTNQGILATDMFMDSSHFWPLVKSDKILTPDIVTGHNGILMDGAVIEKSDDFSEILSTEKKGSYVILGDFKDTCFTNPDSCIMGGMTISFWVKLNQSNINGNQDAYIISGGGQSKKSRGFAFLYFHGNFVACLSTAHKQWKIIMPSFPDNEWVNAAFVWNRNETLLYYLNGKLIKTVDGTVANRPYVNYTILTISRPNNAIDQEFMYPLKMSALALWDRPLKDFQLQKCYENIKSVHQPKVENREKQIAPNKRMSIAKKRNTLARKKNKRQNV
ncbi:uncharacterized protein LOC100202174 isoform X1 [Hydra vulgaris]|uniref:uncharacterized protein LOC100202174 isoform X1 n=1 Tax=Hydra vulgaris TaxID=6087 RepID=UPI001F5EF6E0|nr:uncharacterized protein LOC100202174 isoform X2 [Hydra vulgaris]